MWFHAAVLDIFRPCLQRHPWPKQYLRTFFSVKSSPDAAVAASTRQLQRLVALYRLRYRSSAYSILWHPALMYTANSVLRNDIADPAWLSEFLVCIYGYAGLRRSWRVTESITQALLSMALTRSGGPTSAMARAILKEVRESGDADDEAEAEGIWAPFMANLQLAASDPQAATVEQQAATFEDHTLIAELTSIFDSEQQE